MKKNVQGDKPFTLNKHVRERLNQWDNIAKGRTTSNQSEHLVMSSFDL
jgi:hypothetical protein